MNKKYAIFDMDGTLIDSMGYWQQLAREYLINRGVTDIPDNLTELIKTRTVNGTASLFIELFGFRDSPQHIADGINALMDEHYRRDIPLKDGVWEALQHLHGQGVHMCVASATTLRLMEICLKRLEIRDYFDFLLSCEQVGAGKDQPLVYLEAARQLNARPKDIAVYEDALFAARTAKNAGFYVVGVYDSTAAASWPDLCRATDESLFHW